MALLGDDCLMQKGPQVAPLSPSACYAAQDCVRSPNKSDIKLTLNPNHATFVRVMSGKSKTTHTIFRGVIITPPILQSVEIKIASDWQASEKPERDIAITKAYNNSREEIIK